MDKELGMVPKFINQCWIGPDPVPVDWCETWPEMHPAWGYRLWREEDIDSLPWPTGAREVYDKYIADERYCGAVNVARVLILALHGGVYIDADMVCIKTMENAFFMDSKIWISQSPHNPARSQNAAMGCEQGSAVMQSYLNHLCEVGDDIHPSWQKTGAVLFDHVKDTHFLRPAVTMVPSPAFHPRTKLGTVNRAAWGYTGSIYAEHYFYSTHGRNRNDQPSGVRMGQARRRKLR
jgi:hypothetical protein